jgi:transforming growth factor-beta-induced protein
MKKYALLPMALAVSAVLAVQSFLAPTAEAKPRSQPTIVDIVLANPDVDGDGEGDFNILLDAVLLADASVLERLSAKGQNTVFAPTDAAFEAAFEELAMLGIDPGDVLANTELLTLILNYHLSPGRRDSGSVLASTKIRMRDGGFLQQNGGILTDNLGRQANIIAVDVKASNGIIHVIDNVVLPGL